MQLDTSIESTRAALDALLFFGPAEIVEMIETGRNFAMYLNMNMAMYEADVVDIIGDPALYVNNELALNALAAWR